MSSRLNLHDADARRSIENEIERLIAMLDRFDPDPDLEPHLGWTAGEAASEEYSPEGLADLEEQHDLEMNDYDGETGRAAERPQMAWPSGGELKPEIAMFSVVCSFLNGGNGLAVTKVVSK